MSGAVTTSLLVKTKRGGLVVRSYGLSLAEDAKAFARSRGLRLVEQTLTERELAL